MPAIDDARAGGAQKCNISRPIDYARAKSGSYEEERATCGAQKPATAVARGTSRQAHNRSPERRTAPSLRTSLPQTTRRDRERDALEGDSLGFEWPETIPGNAIHEVGAQRNFNARDSKNANE
jgi:hypothetical protein